MAGRQENQRGRDARQRQPLQGSKQPDPVGEPAGDDRSGSEAEEIVCEGERGGIDSFWLWGYGDPPPETVIVLGLEPSYVYSLFETCSIGGTIANPYGIQNEESQDHPDILLCRHLRQPWQQFWENFHYFG